MKKQAVQRLFQAGYWGLDLAAVLFTMAYVLPFWAVVIPPGTESHESLPPSQKVMGLWTTCTQLPLNCSFMGLEYNPEEGTFFLVRLTLTLTLLLSVYVGVSHFLLYAGSGSRCGITRCPFIWLEPRVVSLVAAISGCFGCILYVLSYRSVPYQESPPGSIHLHHAYFIASASLILNVICSVVVGCCGSKLRKYEQQQVRTLHVPRRSVGFHAVVQFPTNGRRTNCVTIPYLGNVSVDQLEKGRV